MIKMTVSSSLDLTRVLDLPSKRYIKEADDGEKKKILVMLGKSIYTEAHNDAKIFHTALPPLISYNPFHGFTQSQISPRPASLS